MIDRRNNQYIKDGDQRVYEFAAEIRRETDRAYLLFDGVVESWFPKSLTDNNGDGTFIVPEWLAIEKGIV